MGRGGAGHGEGGSCSMLGHPTTRPSTRPPYLLAVMRGYSVS